MLIGRERELSKVSTLLADAGRGDSGVMVITGEPGSGKTTLLEAALADTSALVLRTRGIEIESEMPYVGIGDIFRPVKASLASLPRRQAEALSGALTLGPSVTGDRFAVSIATLTLLGALAGPQPVVVVVDDVQWVDRFSVQVLAFTGRRLNAEGVVLLFASRENDLEGLGLDGFGTLKLGGLDRASARTLLRLQHSSASLSPDMVDRLITETGGNPLALVELPTLIEPWYFANPAPASEPLPVGELLRRAFGVSVRRLPVNTQNALLLLAILDSVPLKMIELALARIGLTLGSLDPAEVSGLIADQRGRITFRHPLVRAVVYHGAPATRRRAGHLIAAELLRDSTITDAPERCAWHLILGEGDADETLANQLNNRTEQRMLHHSYAAAAHSYARAAQLTPTGEQKSLRLLLAANATRLAGRIAEAAILLEQASAITEEPRLRFQADFSRYRLDMWRGNARSGRDGLLTLAAQIEAVDPGTASSVLTDVAIASVELGDLDAAEDASERACRLAQGTDGSGSEAAHVMRAFVMVLRGEKEKGRELLRRREPVWDSWDPLSRELADQLMLVAGLCHFALEERQGMLLVARAVQSARESEATGVLRSRLGHLSWIEFTHGNWNHALALAHETLLLAEETGGTNVTPMALANLARIEAGLGRAKECRQHSAQAEQHAAETGTLPYIAYARYGLGLLALGRRELPKAKAHLEQVAQMAKDFGAVDTPILPWTSLLAEVYAQSGDRSETRDLLAVLEKGQHQIQQPTTAAVADRCRALIDPSAFEEHFVSALLWHEKSSVPFETARTQLCYGENLRRAGRRAEARAQLELARHTFEQLGATDWRNQAVSELRASGVRNLAAASEGPAILTPQENQVALAVADGLTNSEAATKLFLSVKTVEFHLGNVYRKLGLTRRSQLVKSMMRQSPQK